MSTPWGSRDLASTGKAGGFPEPRAHWRKYDCHTCWARPICAGGCHHEAFVRYGDTGHPNLHYCDWIRDLDR